MTKITKNENDIHSLILNGELVGKTLLLRYLNGYKVSVHTVEVTKELHRNSLYTTKMANGKTGTINWRDLQHVELYSGKPIVDKFTNVFDHSVVADGDDVLPLIKKLEDTLDIEQSLGPLPYDLLTRIVNKEDDIWITGFVKPVSKKFSSVDKINVRRVVEGKLIKIAIFKGNLYVYIEADGKSKRVPLHSCVYNENKNEHIPENSAKDYTDGYDTVIDFNDQVAAAYKGKLIVGRVIGINGNMSDILPVNLTPDNPVISIYNNSMVVLEKTI